ncbi:MAG: 4Fe-4S dicluster domain-containing protein [Peptococcaceae bacterium]|nr:4Fe-4S dicluster domain-containing protein [Peptococcaceae bacterium]
MRKIAKTRIDDVLRALASHYDLYVPVEGATTRTSDVTLWQEGLVNASRFRLYEEGLPLYWRTNTGLSPKDLFFPQTEKMYTAVSQNKTVEIYEEPADAKPIILFGVRSCDMASIDCMDRVFLQKGYEDTYYRNRRQRTHIFALGCSTHEDACFCTSMDIDPQAAPAADVQISDLGDAFGFTPQSAKGQQTLAYIDGFLSDAYAATPLPTDPMLINVPLAGVTEKLETMFDHPLWDELSPRCIGCGACTFLCPTCYCFDINHKSPAHTHIVKQRSWDSCMFIDYTCMAGGHNPRPSKTERVRNRFLDKLLYNRQRHGRVFCVGCGRCVAKCPVSLEIATVIQKIQAAEVNP